MKTLPLSLSIFYLVSIALGSGVNLTNLGPLLSPNASIAYNTLEAPRWSQFPAPNPGAVVSVATENDVLVTVQYCITNDIPFLAQNGGHGTTTTFNLANNGVIVNLAKLNQLFFNAAKTEITLQGGASVGDVVAAAYVNNALVSTGTCDCIGLLGAGLGGGFGNLVGLYGPIVDNFISVNMVTPAGTAITVTPLDVDLWWAIRGSGPNFGIITSATMRSYPVETSGLSAWMGSLTFSEDKLEHLVQAMDSLFLQPKMAISLIFAAADSQTNTTISIIAGLFYYGTETAGRAAFSPIYALGPATDDTGVRTYDKWNDDNVGACTEGQRKQFFGAGLASMVPSTWRALYNEYQTFVQDSGAVESVVIMNAESMVKARSFPDTSSAYPFRSTINFFAWAQPWYTNASIDVKAKSWGLRSRDLLRSTSGLVANSTYINNAYGDESLSVVYGNSVQRLKALKAVVDPDGRFNQWFPLI